MCRFPFNAISLVMSFALLGGAASADEAAKLLPPDRPIEQAIDHYVDGELKAAKLKSAPLAEPSTLLRRLTLDLAGRIPTIHETADYVGSIAADKKAQAVDRLLASSGYVRHQAQEFLTLLQIPGDGRRGSGRGPLHGYLLAGFAENRRWDRIFREVMLPEEGDPKTQGAQDFLKSRVNDLNRLTIDVSTTFFGVNISCAQCHDHPHVQDWTQDHFYGLKSFLARTFDNGGFLAERDFGLVKYIPNKGKEKVAPVMFLTGKTIAAPGLKEPTKEERKKEQDRLDDGKKKKKSPAPPSFSLRAQLVETALEPGQRDFFARAIVNRLWHRLFGRGLVMPLDQMHASNPPSHPELLQWLARDLVDHGYDLRRLMRGMVLSDAYARGSRWDGDNPPLEKLFAVAQVRPLTPMQMAVSLKLAATDPAALPGAKAEMEKRLDALEKGAERLAAFFPQPGENFQVSVTEALLFANNENLSKELFAGSGTLIARLMALPDAEKRVDLAVRTVLCRAPRPQETKALAEYLRRREDRIEAACQQMVWALLTSAEFRFNH